MFNMNMKIEIMILLRTNPGNEHRSEGCQRTRLTFGC